MGKAGIFVQGLTEISSTQKQELGTIREEGNKTYKYVQFVAGTGSVAFAAGDVVFYSDYSASKVTADLTDVAPCAAGISMVAVTSSEFNYYGWIQIEGIYSPLNTDVAAGAAGNAMTHVGAADKTLDVSAAVTDPIVGFLIDATASAQVLLCRFPR